MVKAFSRRALKEEIGLKLAAAENDAAFEFIRAFPEHQVIGALFSLFHDKSELIRWRAISAFGITVDLLAGKNMESARVIMRRLMWNLNDESGGIGWGSPEAMGDIMARNRKIAGEYHGILLSYAAEDQNFLEHEMLQQGLLWGIGRLGRNYPGYVLPMADHLNRFLLSQNPILRGLGLWAIMPLKSRAALPMLKKLIEDPTLFLVYDNYVLRQCRISELAGQAIDEQV